jgi:DNA-binding Lrp family transcriptional regulator
MSKERKIESKLKEVELRVIAELMKNSRRSDRELAKVLGISQPTVSRAIGRLESKGIIKEYTMIPDFAKLGYTMMGITQMKVDETSQEYSAQAREKAAEIFEKETAYANIMAVAGTGGGKNRLFITFYKNYGEYSETMRFVRLIPFSAAEDVQSFLVDLEGESHYRLLTMSEIARHILKDTENAANEIDRSKRRKREVRKKRNKSPL